MPGVVSSLFPPSCPAFPTLCVAGRPVRVSLILARWYAIPCGLCVTPARSGCPSGIPRVSFVCVCARALPASAPPPLPGLVWRAHLARSRCWVLVGPFHAVRAPPRVLPRSHAPFGLLWGGGAARSRFSPTWLGAVLSPWGGSARLWRSNAGGRGGEGAGCAPSSPLVWPGGPVGRGVALPRSVPLPSLGRQQSGSLWRRSGHGGRGPHTAPVRARLLSPGVVCVASLCAGAGLLVHRGFCGGRRLGEWRRALLRPPPPRAAVLPGGGGTVPSALGEVGGPRSRGLRVGGGEWGGGRAVVLHLPPPGGRPLAPCPDPPSSPAHSPRVYVFSRGRGAAAGAGRGLPPAGQPGGGAGGEGRPVCRPPLRGCRGT